MSRFLEQPEVVEIANEKSVRGCVVRSALEKAADADAEQYALLSEAVRELLEHFESQGGKTP